ncbi:MAG: hypothetical protein LW807_05045 [Proteobacteria bacterium]|nr:hypothetical protein [Pseudomonadota bacterium]
MTDQTKIGNKLPMQLDVNKYKNTTPEHQAHNMLTKHLKNDRSCNTMQDLVKSFALDNNSILGNNQSFITRGHLLSKQPKVFVDTYSDKWKQITNIQQINQMNSANSVTATIGDNLKEDIGLSGSFFVDTNRSGHTFKKVYGQDFLTYFEEYLNDNPGKSLYDMLNKPIMIDNKKDFLLNFKVNATISGIMGKFPVDHDNLEDAVLFDAIGSSLFNEYNKQNKTPETNQNTQGNSLFAANKDSRRVEEKITGFMHKTVKLSNYAKNKISSLLTLLFSDKKKAASKEQYINDVFKLSHIAKDNKSQIKISKLKTEIIKLETSLENNPGYVRHETRKQINSLSIQIEQLTVLGKNDFVEIIKKSSSAQTENMQKIIEKLSNNNLHEVEKENLVKELIGETYQDFLSPFDNNTLNSINKFSPAAKTNNDELVQISKGLLKGISTPIKFTTMQGFFGNGTVKIALENYFKDYMVDKSGVYLDYTMTKATFDELNLKEDTTYMDGVYFVVDEDKSETTMYVVNGNYKDPIENSTRLLSALYSEYTNAPHTIITKEYYITRL